MSRKEKLSVRDGIAVVGMGCRFPCCGESVEEFWGALLSGRDCIGRIPADRWDAEAFYHPDYTVRGKMQVMEGGFIEGIDLFDAQFFGISPVEASRMDPQQRILLEVVYHALEDAGMTFSGVAGSRTGVYVGISSTDYAGIQNSYTDRAKISAYSNTGAAPSIAANRISYLFDLRGPSMAVDTACSSGLVAAHLACRSIWSGETEMAIVGAANVLIRPEFHIGFSKGGFLSPSCRSKAFDADADGYVRSEGVGAVVLKRLCRALSDGDRIHSVIAGSALNEDGHTTGISMPNLEAQVDVLRRAYADAGVDPSGVDYVEAHGTGTPVGDPLECASLAEVLTSRRRGKRSLPIGSVKSNIGHLEPASGLAGMIKASLILERRRIPRSLHFKKPNPAVDFDALRLRVPTDTEIIGGPAGRKLTAGVNSFGFGGANAHVVMQSCEEGGKRRPAVQKRANDIIPLFLSARSEAALSELAASYSELIRKGKPDLGDLRYSAALRRSELELRASIPCDDHSSAAKLLDKLAAGENDELIARGMARVAGGGRKVAFIYCGQGPQWHAMGRELMRGSKIFKDTIDEVGALLKGLGWQRRERSTLSAELQKDERHSRMSETEIAQPAIFAIQVALTRLWEGLGVVPDGILGHSVGEVAGAWASGALSLSKATELIFVRSLSQAPASGRGKMLAAGIGAEEAESRVLEHGGRFVIAAANGSSMVTLSGETEALEQVSSELEADGIFHRFLNVDVPFHSHFMDDVVVNFKRSLGRLNPSDNHVRLYSTVSGCEIAGCKLTTDYWGQNIRRGVLFYPAACKMAEDGYDIFVEIGPHPVLARGIEEALREKDIGTGLIVSSMMRGEGELGHIRKSLGMLFCGGARLLKDKMFEDSVHEYIPLPSYPWQRERFWSESSESRILRHGTRPHPHLVSQSRAPGDSGAVLWKVDLDAATAPYIADHRVQGPIVYPGAGHVDLILSSARASFGEDFGFIEDIEFMEPLFLPESGEPYPVQISICSDEGDFTLATKPSASNDEWTVHSKGRINHTGDAFEHRQVNLEELLARITMELEVAPLMSSLAQGGLQLGKSFRGLKKLWCAEGESLGLVRTDKSILHDFMRHAIHPALLDASFQTAFGIISGTGHEGVYIPVRIARVKFHKTPGQTFYSYARAISYGDDIISADIWLVDKDGDTVLEIQGFRAKYLKGSRGETTGNAAEEGKVYAERWVRRDRRGDPRKAFGHVNGFSGLRDPMLLEAGELKKDAFFHEFAEAFSPFADKIAVCYMSDALSASGAMPAKDRSLSKRQIENRVNIATAHKELMARILSHLVNYGALDFEGGRYTRGSSFPCGESASLLADAKKCHPGFLAELSLLELCGKALPDILAGRRSPIELLFSPEARGIITEYYSTAYTFDKYHRMLSAAVERVVSGLPEDRTLRILEIGAGTGGITQMILPMLPENRTEYVFTDISQDFISHARKRFSKFSFVDYKTLDITQDISSQGLIPGEFDLVIASNVVHGTPDVLDTAVRIRSLLAEGGMFLMLEVTRTGVYPDIVFGMTEGWWNYLKDPWGRESCSMEPCRWLDVLEKAGFSDGFAVSDLADDFKGCPVQNVFACRNPRTPATAEAPEDRIEKGRWLVVPDSQGNAEKLARALSKLGHQIETHTKIDPGHLAKIANGSSHIPLKGVIYMHGMDIKKFAAMHDNTIMEALRNHFFPLVGIANWLENAADDKPPSLWIVGAGIANLADSSTPSIEQAPLVGLGRVIANEVPGLNTHIADLGTKPTDAEIEGLVKEIVCGEPEGLHEIETAFRGTQRYVRRLERVNTVKREIKAVRPAEHAGRPCRWEQEDSVAGQTALKARFFDICPPCKGEVSIEVKYAGMNFRDAMLASGALPDEALDGGIFSRSFGLECSGKVICAGEDAGGFKPGDEVLSIAAGAAATRVNAKSAFTFKLPKGLSLKDAACLPMAYLTAYYSLDKVASLRPGEKVLIHSAAGGVGIAAVNVARIAGAEIFATAALAKHDFLRSIGIEHVYDSRSPEFHDRIMMDTGGKGVDVVLNSLAGPMMLQGLKTLAPGGRFIEIGKKDIFENRAAGLGLLKHNRSFATVDIDRLLLARPEVMSQCMDDLFGGKAVFDWNEGKLIRHPTRLEEFMEFPKALRKLSSGENPGKSLVEIKGGISALPPQNMKISHDGCYLVAGGTSGLGLALGKLLALKGAGCVALASRSGKPRPEDMRAIEEIKRTGTRLILAATDVSKRKEVEKLIRSINSEECPLKGVFQSSMQLSDKPLPKMDWESFSTALGSKILGTWNLHIATEGLDLDYFVCFSSIASVYGTPGQSNYAAGNSFLDAMAHFRRAKGLPATTLNWGVVGETGYVFRNSATENFLANHGWQAMPLSQLLAEMERAIAFDEPQTGVFDVDWRVFAETFPHNKETGAIAHLHKSAEEDSAESHDDDRSSLSEKLRACPPEDRKKIADEYIRTMIARVLGLRTDKIDLHVPITKLGIDSLMSNQIRSWLTKQSGVSFSLMQIMQGPSVSEMSRTIIKSLFDDATAIASPEQNSAWLITPAPSPKATRRIFCFPYMGAGASVYNSWHSHLPNSLMLTAIQFPGREERIDEKPINDTRVIFRQLAAAIIPLLDRPFYLYGHSFGGNMAMNFAAYLSDLHGKAPEGVFISAAIPPSVNNPLEEGLDFRKNETQSFVDDDTLMALLMRLEPQESLKGDKEAIRRLLPAFRADLRLSRQKHIYGDKILPCPITAIAAEGDNLYTPDMVAQWASHTNDFKLHVIPGRHLFIHDERGLRKLLGLMLGAIRD